MRSVPRRIGDLGEAIAARWLRQRGWVLLARQYRVGRRDIDLIAQQGATIAFVEVKTRRSSGFGGPISAVGARKRRHLSRAAVAWMDRYGPPGAEYRFDVVGVLIAGDLVRVAHLENAFVADLAR